MLTEFFSLNSLYKKEGEISGQVFSVYPAIFLCRMTIDIIAATAAMSERMTAPYTAACIPDAADMLSAWILLC